MSNDSPNGPTTSTDPTSPDPTDVEKNKVFAILAYLGILFLVPLLAAKDSPFARYHTNQGVILFIAAVCIWIPLAIIGMIPFIGLVVLLLFPLAGLGIFVMIILGILNAAQGKMKPLPIIGTYTLIK